MADQTQRLEIATVRAEIGGNIVYHFTNDPAANSPIPTDSGNIPNLKQVIAQIQEGGAEKISIATTIYQSPAAGLAATADGGIFLVQSADADTIYTVWKNQAGSAVNTGKTAMSSQAIQDALTASNEAAQAAEDAADVATARTAGFLQPSAAAPVVRDDGLPLQIGDRYFNTAEQAEYLYKEDGWAVNDSLAAVVEISARFSVEPGPGKTPQADSDGLIRLQWLPESVARQSDLVQAMTYKASGAGAVDSTVKKKLALLEVSVEEYGAVGGPTDDAAAFQAAIDALSAGGGTIRAQGTSYRLDTAPNEGSKSICWMIGTHTAFSGAGTGQGKFPYMSSNTAQLAVGPYIRSRSAQHSTHANGGIAAFNVEMLQPADYVGQSVAGYFGAIGSSPTAGANVWAVNTLIRAQAGAKGIYQCIEVDVDNFSADALVKGISISGAGTANPSVAIEAVRAGTTSWKTGIELHKCIAGVRVFGDPQTVIGIIVGDPAAKTNAVLSGQQLADSHDCLLMQRFTDTAPTGNFFRAVNAANSQILARIGIDGAISTVSTVSATLGITSTAGNVRGVTIEASGPASASIAGGFRLSASTSATVGAAGGAAALPAAPAKYIVVNQDGVNYKMPLYIA
jgi:hypothetical protein